MFTLNEGQENVVSAAVDWFRNSSELVFQYTGAAGTGKTVVLNEIINRLGLSLDQIAPMSYTGTAAIVMRNRGLTNARTIHSTMYEPMESMVLDEKGKPIMDEYFNKPLTKLKWFKRYDLPGVKLIIIDEASMTPASMVKDIESYGIKILACGDLNQLPPVGDNPGYLVSGKVHRLTQIMRQAEQSGIVYLADRAIKGLPIQFGFYNNAMVVPEDEVSDDIFNNADIILCGKNKTKEDINNYVRTKIRRIQSTIPLHCEPLICRKNNWQIESNGINLVNGLRGIVADYPDVSKFDGRTMLFDFVDAGGNMFPNLKLDYSYYKANTKDRERIKSSPYTQGNLFESAYAITVHLSQGSQYHNGIMIEEYLHRDIMSNFIYTGITRFSNFMIYIKPKPKYY